MAQFHTFQNVLDGAKVTYPEIGDTVGLGYIKRIWRRFVNAAQIEAQEESVDMVSGTREYTKDSSTQPVDKVRDVYYITSATAAKKLEPVSTDWLDKYGQTDWRTTTKTGEPSRYYFEAKDDGTVKIGFDPIPDTTKTGGYPIVTMYGSSYRVPALANEVPGIVSDIEFLIEGVKMLHAKDKDVSRFPVWQELFDQYLHEQLAYVISMQEDGDVPKIEYAHLENAVVQ